ncbi:MULTISPECIES: alpha/beta hydrolase [unclassified Microbacterium]|uniref:alpha/beta hydrolase n=1 Tax=unclassified Microbacterium TaxID=2609290 RepID=UPI000C2CB921|nr:MULTISPECIES: alpha/beta hydrolase [unclassified Microbacterium]
MSPDGEHQGSLDPVVARYVLAHRGREFSDDDRDRPAAYLMRLRDGFPVRSLGTADTVTIESIAPPGGPAERPARLYRARYAGENGISVFLHGGGWVAGRPEHYDELCVRLVELTGTAVLSVDYALAPESPYPAALRETSAMIDWAVRSRESLGISGDVGLIGVSAGGNLAAAAALLGRDGLGSLPAYQVLIYPVLDRSRRSRSYRRHGTGFLTTAAQLEWFWEQYAGAVPADAPSPAGLSPNDAEELSGLPPTLTIVAELDPLHDEGVEFAERLARSGVRSEIVDCPGMIHGFVSLFGEHPQTERALDAIGRFVRDITLPERDIVRSGTHHGEETT